MFYVLISIQNIIPYSSETTLAGPLIHADVRLKFSPFSEKLWTFIEPSSLLIINSRAKEHSRCFSFNFGPQQLEDLKTSIDTTVELRFCLLNSSCEQSDNFPKNLRINVNGKLCVLPNLLPNERGKPPAHIPGPVNISCYLNCSTSVPNVIWCDWTSEANRVHVISCFLVCIMIYLTFK